VDKISVGIEEVVRRFLEALSHKKRVSEAYLFGSHAKGTASVWSDIDLAVVSPDFSEDLFLERLMLMRVAAEIDERIEPKPFRPEDFQPSDPLVNEIRQTGIALH